MIIACYKLHTSVNVAYTVDSQCYNYAFNKLTKKSTWVESTGEDLGRTGRDGPQNFEKYCY